MITPQHSPGRQRPTLCLEKERIQATGTGPHLTVGQTQGPAEGALATDDVHVTHEDVGQCQIPQLGQREREREGSSASASSEKLPSPQQEHVAFHTCLGLTLSCWAAPPGLLDVHCREPHAPSVCAPTQGRTLWGPLLDPSVPHKRPDCSCFCPFWCPQLLHGLPLPWAVGLFLEGGSSRTSHRVGTPGPPYTTLSQEFHEWLMSASTGESVSWFQWHFFESRLPPVPLSLRIFHRRYFTFLPLKINHKVCL